MIATLNLKCGFDSYCGCEPINAGVICYLHAQFLNPSERKVLTTINYLNCHGRWSYSDANTLREKMLAGWPMYLGAALTQEIAGKDRDKFNLQRGR